MTTALEGGEGLSSRPGRSLPPGKTRYPLYRRLGGPQGRSGQMRKISPPPGFDPRTEAIKGTYSAHFNFGTNALKMTGLNETWFRNTGTQFLTVVKIFVNSCRNLLFLTRPGHVGAHSQFVAHNLLPFQLLSQQKISLRLSSRGSLYFDLERKCPSSSLSSSTAAASLSSQSVTGDLP